MAVQAEKPIIVATAFNAPGHSAGVIRISEHLASRGFPVCFIGALNFKQSIMRIGAEFVENPWDWLGAAATRPENPDETWFLKHVFIDSVPTAHRVLRETLEKVRKEHPNRRVVILHESMSGGLGPFVYGTPLPEGFPSLPPVVNFHPSVYATKDDNVPPFGPGFPYDPTPQNLALWKSVYEAMEPAMAGVLEHCSNHYTALGATRPLTGAFFDIFMGLGDVNVLATSPSLEYPLPAPKPNLRFVGGLPLKPLDPDFVFPDWWPTIKANAALPASSPDKKKTVFVTQGTAHLDYTELLLPTLAALADRSDLLVVATLGVRGAELDPAATPRVPANAIVTDYLPYDALLPYTDVFVSNAGYGGFMHGVMNGVPMVLAGTAADKAEVCARAEYAGVGVNLRSQKPNAAAIRVAVDKVLAEETFKRRAVELKQENEALDALGSIEGIIEELAARG